MLRIKKKYSDKKILKGNQQYILSEYTTQKEIQYIKDYVSANAVEEIKEKKSKKKEEDTNDNNTEESK